MQIHLNVPEEIARTFGDDAQSVERAALEALVPEGVRSGSLSRGAGTATARFSDPLRSGRLPEGSRPGRGPAGRGAPIGEDRGGGLKLVPWKIEI